MKERGIIFSGEMVKAILAGRKTQTRRLVKGTFAGRVDAFEPEHGRPLWWMPIRNTARAPTVFDRSIRCPYGVVGDHLWVRETWTHIRGNGIRLWYRADGEPKDSNGRVLGTRPCEPRWGSPRYMRRQDSRITLEITGVRVERLQASTEEDARAEGVESGTIPADDFGPNRIGYVLGQDDGKCLLYPDARRAFEVGWDAINGKKAPWSMNPWVWALTFRRVGGEHG